MGLSHVHAMVDSPVTVLHALIIMSVTTLMHALLMLHVPTLMAVLTAHARMVSGEVLSVRIKTNVKMEIITVTRMPFVTILLVHLSALVSVRDP